ncbi:hypothetical protein FBU30_004093 [Linnemannia zychae]|nr:hypothetical protein FBU30_004093 [Linnemannia zychae]
MRLNRHIAISTVAILAVGGTIASASPTYQATVDPDDWSSILTTRDPVFYRKEILLQYNSLTNELASKSFKERQEKQQQSDHDQTSFGQDLQQQVNALATGADECTRTPKVLIDGLDAVENRLAQILGSFPGGLVVQYALASTLKALLAALGTNKVVGTALMGVSISLAFSTLIAALSLLASISFLNPIVQPAIDILITVQTTLAQTIHCFADKGYIVSPSNQAGEPVDDQKQIEQDQGFLSFSVGHCAWIAKIYQQMVSEAITYNPVTKGLPDASSEDLRRLAQGSLEILKWMQNYSVVSNMPPFNDNVSNVNEDIGMAAKFDLIGKPFFSGKVLNQYMLALLEVTTAEESIDQNNHEYDDIVLYALTSLSLTVNMSNALEACLSL